MEILNISVPAIQQHNAQTAREAEIVREIDRLLRSQSFPSERIWVDVRFDLGMSDHSSSKVSLMQINNQFHGTVEIRLQGFFLMQDFPTFVQEVLPHELAHVLLEIDAAVSGKEVEKGHGDDWVDRVMELNPDSEPAAKVKGYFDERPIKLSRGGILCQCDCDNDDLSAMAVFPNTPATSMKLKNEELTCTTCQSSYWRVTKEDEPESLTKTVQFFENLMALKAHNAPLSR